MTRGGVGWHHQQSGLHYKSNACAKYLCAQGKLVIVVVLNAVGVPALVP